MGNEYVTCNVISVPQNKYKKMAENCLTEGIHVTDTALYKFDIANILASVEQVLYLDSDILVCQDISGLFAIELFEYYLAAADEMGDELNEDGKSMLASRIGIHSSTYFNSGVMLLNLRRLRRENVIKELLEYRSSRINYFMDQDAFNGVMYGRRLKLPCCYNFRTALFDIMLPEEIGEKFYHKKYMAVKDCLSDQKIIHLSSQFKPWKYNIPWITDLFMKYYEMSPYKNNLLELKSSLKGLYDVYEPWKKDIKILSSQYDILLSKYRQAFEERNQKIWGFPYAKVRRGSRIVLYGAGDVGNDFKMQIDASDYCSLVLWVDRNYAQIKGSIRPPEEIKKIEFDYILIAVANEKAVRGIEEYLKQFQIIKEKIVTL